MKYTSRNYQFINKYMATFPKGVETVLCDNPLCQIAKELCAVRNMSRGSNLPTGKVLPCGGIVSETIPQSWSQDKQSVYFVNNAKPVFQ